MISHLEESIIMGTLAISGSAIMRFKNVTMASFPSIKPSSILMSMIWAPPSTCSLAISMASSKASSLMSRRNFFDPATLVRSPTLTKLDSFEMIKGSRPASFNLRSSILWAYRLKLVSRLKRCDQVWYRSNLQQC